MTKPIGYGAGNKLTTADDASSLTNLPAAQLAGDVARARISTALATGGDPVTGTVVTAATRIDAPSIGTAAGAQHALPAGTAALVADDNAKLPPTPSGAGKILYDNGSAYVAANAGTAGQVATSSGATVSFQDPITATKGEASLSAASYAFTTNGFEDIGLTITLPSTGTYLVWASIRASISTSVGTGNITYRLHNTTAAMDFADSERLGPLSAAGQTNTLSFLWVVSVTGATAIRVDGITPAGPTYTARTINSDADGYTRIGYVKIGP